MSEIRLRRLPRMDVSAEPSAIDTKTKRLLDKELRAAFGERGARWIEDRYPVEADRPGLILTCHEQAPALQITLLSRISLAHFVAGVRAQLPHWALYFTAEGIDGDFHLAWPRGAGAEELVSSLMGRVAKDRTYESPGRKFWDERDGGLSVLGIGRWIWDSAAKEWRD